MEHFSTINYLQLIKRRWSFITVVTLVVLLIALVLTLVQPFKYQSEVSILVIQKSAVGIDAYSASKSAERIGHNLSQIIYSSDFFSKVMNAGFAIDSSYFPNEENKRRKEWQKTIAAEVTAATTILDVKVFHPDPDEATKIAQAIAFVLDQDAQEYVGVSDVDLKVVDDPLTSNFPVKPNIFINSILGLLVGFFFAVSYVFVKFSDIDLDEQETRAEKKHRRREEKRIKKESRMSRAVPVPEIQEEEMKDHEDEEIQEEPSLSKHLEHDRKIALPDLNAPDVEEMLDGEPDQESEQEYSDLPSFEDEDEIKTLPEK